MRYVRVRVRARVTDPPSPSLTIPLLSTLPHPLTGTALIPTPSPCAPSIPKVLEGIYSDRPQNADGATAVAISRGAASPGANNVIGSGQKLPPQRPLNEVMNASTHQLILHQRPLKAVRRTCIDGPRACSVLMSGGWVGRQGWRGARGSLV